MFDIGFWEMLLIGVVALVVIGPERLPEVARTAGVYVAKFRRFVAGVKSDINSELETGELKKILGDQKEQIQELRSMVDSTRKDIESSTSEVLNTAKENMSSAEERFNKIKEAANHEANPVIYPPAAESTEENTDEAAADDEFVAQNPAPVKTQPAKTPDAASGIEATGTKAGADDQSSSTGKSWSSDSLKPGASNHD